MKNSIIIIFFSFCSFPLIADIQSFDVFKLKVGSKVYYFELETRGPFNQYDLCYAYSETNLEDFVNERITDNNLDTIELYKDLHFISLGKLKGFDAKTLVITKNKIKVATSSLINNFEVIEAFHGNMYGYTYTQELNNNDNTWINDYPVIKIFDLSDNQLCSMTFYSIKGNLRPIEQWKIRWKLTKILRKENGYNEFNKELSILYKRNIIMIGFCSC